MGEELNDEFEKLHLQFEEMFTASRYYGPPPYEYMRSAAALNLAAFPNANLHLRRVWEHELTDDYEEDCCDISWDELCCVGEACKRENKEKYSGYVELFGSVNYERAFTVLKQEINRLLEMGNNLDGKSRNGGEHGRN